MTDEAKTPTPPAPAPAQDDDPNIIGKLSEEEMGQWQALQRQANTVVMEMGNMFVRAVRNTSQLDRFDATLQTMVKGAVLRMGVPEDMKYNVLPDGRIRLIAEIPKRPTEPPKEEEAKAEAKEDTEEEEWEEEEEEEATSPPEQEQPKVEASKGGNSQPKAKAEPPPEEEAKEEASPSETSS